MDGYFVHFVFRVVFAVFAGERVARLPHRRRLRERAKGHPLSGFGIGPFWCRAGSQRTFSFFFAVSLWTLKTYEIIYCDGQRQAHQAPRTTAKAQRDLRRTYLLLEFRCYEGTEGT